MENLGLWLGMLSGVVLVLWLAPNIFRSNAGSVLRNLAIWLGIFVLLGWFYHLFGPFGTVAESRLRAPNPPAASESAPIDDGGVPVRPDDGFSPPADDDVPVSKPL